MSVFVASGSVAPSRPLEAALDAPAAPTLIVDVGGSPPDVGRGGRGGALVAEDAQAAFDAFVRARLPELLRFGCVLTGNPETAADLVQDALERTLLAWPRLHERDEPTAYVRRVMVNRNISIWRRLRRETLAGDLPDQASEDRQRDHDLWAALQSLPPRQRAVLALRYYEDLSEAEIARVLGCSTGTVKSQASKGVAKMRALLPTSVPGGES